MIDIALRYIAAGWPVLPVWSTADGKCLCERASLCPSPGKHPRADLVAHGVKDATLDPEIVAKWPAGISLGVALGQVAGNVMVFDVDDREVASRLLDPNLVLSDQTGIVATGRGGAHIWFRSGGPTSTFYVKGERKIGEVRGDGAYVVVPPSVAVTGRPYRWVGLRLDDAPPQLEVVANPARYIVELLSLVGVSIESAGQQPASDVQMPSEISPCDIPHAIESDARLTDTRRVLAGVIPVTKEPDRSGKLFAIVSSMVEVAKERAVPLSRLDVAGVAKKSDQLYYHKFTDRASPDIDYWRLALKVLPEGDLVGGDATTPKHALQYTWDEAEGVLTYKNSQKAPARKIANFRPVILEEIEIDQGSRLEDKRQRHWKVRFTLASGRSKEFYLKHEEIEQGGRGVERAMARECSSAYVVEPGMHAYVKAALQTMSEDPVLSRAFALTGWITHGDSWLYLLPGAPGAVVANSQLDPSVRIDRDRLAGETVTSESLEPYGKGVRPALTKDEERACLQAFLDLVQAGPPQATLPIVLQVLAGPLTSAGVGDVPPLIHVMGKTGTLKTSYCLAALSLMGTFTETTPAPASWSSTANYLGIMLHTTKDLTLLVDDYKRGVVASSRGEILRLIQNYADRTGRGRARPDQKTHESPVPRGLLLTNGEDRWESEASAVARTITIYLKSDDIDIPLLSRVQEAVREGTLQLFGGSYLSWLASKPGLLEGQLFREKRVKWHSQLLKLSGTGKAHLRILASLASLLTVSSLMVDFVKERFSKEAATLLRQLIEQAVQHMVLGAGEQAKEVKEASPFGMLIGALRENLAAQRICLLPANGLSNSLHRIPDKPNAEAVGYYFNEDEDTESAWVLLTRDRTMAWYESTSRGRGMDVGFSWSAFIKEVEDEYGGERVERVRVNTGEKVSQLSGVRLSGDILLGTTW